MKQHMLYELVSSHYYEVGRKVLTKFPNRIYQDYIPVNKR